MTSRKDFEIFLYKNKLNDVTLIEVLEKLTTKTIEMLQKDLNTQEVSLRDDENVFVFTDGNCKNNGKSKSRGGYGVYFTNNEDSIFHKLNTARLVIKEPTNQKAELMAIEKLFEIMNDKKELFGREKMVIVCTDSMYSINCIEKWSKNWLRNNWKTAKGEDVKNAEIIKNILDLKNKCVCKINFRHIRSHMSPPANKETLEYILWEGNYNVDRMINELLKD
jgi:ribonuclease HI